ncbi:MAG: 4-oxalomesaconate tautomerase [Acidimicrobiia bacterium]
MTDTTAGIRCMLMRGGTSKGAFFVQDDLPANSAERDDLLLRIMGSPDPRQIDGVGGAHPLTTKVAVVSSSDRDDADVEYLFLQVGVETAFVTDRQNCGNMLAAVGPFAVERGLAGVEDGTATVRILMRNTGGLAVAMFPVQGSLPVYEGETEISGVPGSAARIEIDFAGIAGASSGSLLPTGNPTDVLSGVEATLVDNGMPVVVVVAAAVGIDGHETCAQLETDGDLREKLEAIRLEAGPLMGLGDVSEATVPKVTLVSPPRQGGAVSTRTFIPHRCHDAIGVLGAVSVATACLIPGSVAAGVVGPRTESDVVVLEHPTGSFEARVTMRFDNGVPVVERAGITRTARKLMDGIVYPRPS